MTFITAPEKFSRARMKTNPKRGDNVGHMGVFGEKFHWASSYTHIILFVLCASSSSHQRLQEKCR